MRAVLIFAMAVLLSAADTSYVQQIEQWRAQREARLKSDSGWLTVAGLFWLNDGDNTAGTAADCDVKLPPGSAPEHFGVFRFHGGKAGFRKTGETAFKDLRTDADKDGPDVLTVNALTMFVIQRGDKFGIRLKDRNSEYRRNFTGLHWYPVKPEYRVAARFVKWTEPKNIDIANILGQTEPTPSPGYVEFTLNGVKARIDALEEDDSLFLIFRDQTAGKTTYGAGRFLNTDMPKNGEVVVDFNQAYNPPCAFTPYATCPLPPPENRLPVAIEAGEMKYGDH